MIEPTNIEKHIYVYKCQMCELESFSYFYLFLGLKIGHDRTISGVEDRTISGVEDRT